MYQSLFNQWFQIEKRKNFWGVHLRLRDCKSLKLVVGKVLGQTYKNTGRIMNIAKVVAWSVIEPRLSGFSNFKEHYLSRYCLGCWSALFWIMVGSVLSRQKPVLFGWKRWWGIGLSGEHPGHWDLLPCVSSAQQLSGKGFINIMKFCRSNWQQNTKPLPRDFTVKHHQHLKGEWVSGFFLAVFLIVR